MATVAMISKMKIRFSRETLDMRYETIQYRQFSITFRFIIKNISEATLTNVGFI